MSRKEHPIWEDELMPYIDGQLDEERASAIAHHVNDCSECSATVADTRRMSEQLAWELEEPSGQMKERVQAEVRSRRAIPQTRVAWWTRNRVWAYGLSAAFVGVVLVFALRTPDTISDRLDALEPEGAPSQLTLQGQQGQQGGQQGQGGQGQQGQGQQGQQAGRQNQQGQQGQQGHADKSLEGRFELERAQQGQQGQQPGQGTLGRLQSSTLLVPDSGPMIVRSARLTIVTRTFDKARSRIEEIAQESQGYLGQLTAQENAGLAKRLSATLRLPSMQMERALVELRKLGTVKDESQGSSDVTAQTVDLQARITNSRNTEQRLLNLLRERTGKLPDVIDAEREVARVREDIERMEAQQKDIFSRVRYATIQVELSEEYRAAIETGVPSVGTRFRNAAILGYEDARESVVSVALFAVRYGPALLLWSPMIALVVILLRRAHRVLFS